MNIVERFWSRVKKSKGCWEWTAGMTTTGYGAFRWKGKMWKAHRVAYELTKGEIPAKGCVCHTCDNTKCVRPEHLFLGTQKDNLDDCWFKGRRRLVHHAGEKNGNSKLTWEEVKRIRQYSLRYRNKSQLGRMFGVSSNNIAEILNNKIWKERRKQ